LLANCLITDQYKTDGILQYGTQCTYDIQSSKDNKKGVFFSPRYPQHYPQNSNCQYMFMGRDNERVRVTFKLVRLPGQSYLTR